MGALATRVERLEGNLTRPDQRRDRAPVESIGVTGCGATSASLSSCIRRVEDSLEPFGEYRR